MKIAKTYFKTYILICFFQKRESSLYRYPENNLFTLKKKLIPIENLKKLLCEKGLFLFLFHLECLEYGIVYWQII